MGTPLPPIPFEPGEPCNICWGPDGPFSLPTPLNVFMTLRDWSEGALFDEAFRPELEGIQELNQEELLPCIWTKTTVNFGWTLEFGATRTAIIVGALFLPAAGVFEQIETPSCQQALSNGFVAPLNNIIFDGTASVYFGSAT